MNSHGVRFGLFAGIGTVFILLTAYYIDKRLMLSPTIVWSTMFFYIIGMAMAPIEERKNREGFISFKEALRTAFIVWIIANAIYHAFLYFHFNYFDLEMLSVQKEQFLEQSKQAGIFSEEQTNTIVEQLSYGLSQTISQYIISLIMGFLLAAGIARLVRRDNFAPKV